MVDRAFQTIVAFAAVIVSGQSTGWAQDSQTHNTDASGIVLTPNPAANDQVLAVNSVTADRAVSSTTADRESLGVTSHYISSMVAAGLPKYDASPKAVDIMVAATKSDGKAGQTTPGIELLPVFIVRDTKIPNEDHILTYKGRAKIAMDKYLGPSDGLDRGVLNSYTLPQLWRKIPILPGFLSIFGGLQFVGTAGSMSNEARGFDAGGANDTIPYPHRSPKVKDGSDE